VRLSRALILSSSIYLGVFSAFYSYVNYAQSIETNRLDELRSQWVGQYPHKGETVFLNEPKVKDQLQQMLGQRFEALVVGKYMEEPIDYIAGYYVLSFAANPHLIREGEWIYIIIREYTGSVHIAIKDFENQVTWKHSAESDIPPRILKMLDLWDTVR
jgi:hypothetical protein